MKVLHYVPSLAVRTGGVAAYLAVLSLELGKLVDLHIATHDEGELEQESVRLVVLFFCKRSVEEIASRCSTYQWMLATSVTLFSKSSTKFANTSGLVAAWDA